MFKIIDINLLDDDIHNIYTACNNINHFERTLAYINNESILDLTQRSSWTYKNKIQITTPELAKDFLIENNILHDNYNENMQIKSHNEFTLLKYEPGDFFNNHIDTKINDSHIFTCLIFLPNNELEGGELLLCDKLNKYEIRINPQNFNQTTMIVFSIDMYHKVLPITKGTRYVLKKPLFKCTDQYNTLCINDLNNKKMEKIKKVDALEDNALEVDALEVDALEDDVLEDGGCNFLNNYGGGDY
jgi:hypothetical protein